MNRITLAVIIVLLLGGVGYYCYTNFWKAPEFEDSNKPLPLGMAPASGSAVSGGGTDSDEPVATGEELLPTDITTIIDPTKSVPLDTIPESLTVLVNRAFLLPSTYEPEDLVIPNVKFDTTVVTDKNKLRKEASVEFEKLVAAAEKKGLEITAVSGYRSYARQKQVYDSSAQANGREHADKYCALPGSSEHQTGLSMDVSTSSIGNILDEKFGDTDEGKWLRKNAYKYGFIIRYPKGKSKITGYNYEPWHIRYVGKNMAKYIYKNKITLEEYYNVSMNKENKDWRNDL